MTKFDASTALRQTNPKGLSKLLALEAPEYSDWSEHDLPAMLRHQFAAPLEFDLGSMELKDRAARNRDETLTAAVNSRIRSFRDLLFHSKPPLDLLKLSKEFFKSRTAACKKDSPDWKLAYLFYLLCLLMAREHSSELSSLSTKDLLKGTKWALGQSWVDQNTQQLILAARERLLACH
jgi:hypothetical protein